MIYIKIFFAMVLALSFVAFCLFAIDRATVLVGRKFGLNAAGVFNGIMLFSFFVSMTCLLLGGSS